MNILTPFYLEEIDMKICFLCYNLINGGAQRVVSVLSNELIKFHDVMIIVSQREENEYALDSNVEVVELKENNGRSFVERELHIIRKLRGIFREKSPDVVISLLGYENEAYIASRGMKLKFITSIRNSPWSSPAKPYKRMIRNLMVSLSDACMVQNKGQLEYFPKWMHPKLFVVPNPVDDAYLKATKYPHESIRKIVTLGRLREQKNHKLLIAAFGDIIPQIDKNVVLDIYGNGPLREQLQEQVEVSGLAERVQIKPFSTDALSVYRNADLFVLSSNFEGMPNALLEAMAVGLPCISTRCKTGPEDMIINGKTGFLVPVGDRCQLAERMLQVISMGQEAFDIGEAAKDYVGIHNSITAVTEIFLHNISQVCKEE